MFRFPRLILIITILSVFSCEKLKPSNSKVESTETTSRIDKAFLINGTTFNAENKIVYLYKLEDLAFSIVDSTEVSNNQFTFKGLAETPTMHAVSKGKNTAKFQFLVDNSSIDLFLSHRPINSSSFSPTQVQKDYNIYVSRMNALKDKGVSFYYEMRGDFSNQNIKNLKEKRRKLFSEENNFVKEFIEDNPSSLYSAIIIKERLKSYDKNYSKKLYNTLSNEIKTSSVGKQIDTFLSANNNDKQEEKLVATVKPNIKSEKEKQKAVVTVPEEEYRPKAYAINGNNQYGEAMSLNSIPKGKVILVDFWASWCAPCRATNPTLVQLYNRYNSQGFEILSVSEDKGEAEWMNAIAIDGLIWDYHVIDKNKTIAFRYGVESIPFKLLIDKNGNIASEKISGRALENKIQQLLAE